MAIIDMLILSMAAWGFYKGLRKGFFFIVLSLIGIIAGFIIASRLSGRLIPYLAEILHWDEIHLKWVAYVLIFFIVLSLSRIISHLLEKFFKWTGLGWMNRLAGGVVSGLKYLLLAGLLFTAVDEIQQKFQVFPPDTFKESTIYEPLVTNTRKLIQYAGDWKNKYLKNQPENSPSEDSEQTEEI